MRDLPVYFSQRDFVQTLGTNNQGVRIADAGCFLVSLTEAAVFFGKKTDPVALNDLFISQKIYLDGDLLPDNALTRVYPDILFQESYTFPNEVRSANGTIKSPAVPADLTLLKQLLADPTRYVICEVSIGGANTHFVSALGVNGMVTIHNPWTKHVEDFSVLYGDPVKNIIKFICYKGTPVAVDQQLIDQLRGQRDANWSLYQNQMQSTKSVQDQLQAVQDRANDLQSTCNAADTEIAGLKQDVKRITDENTSLLVNYQAKLKEDSTAVDIGIKSPTIISDLRDYIRAIAEYLRVTAVKKTDKEIVEEVLGEVAKLKQIHTTDDDAVVIRSNYERIVTYLSTLGLQQYLEKHQVSAFSSNAGEHIVYFISLLLPSRPTPPPVTTSLSPTTAKPAFLSRLLSTVWVSK